MSYQSGMSEAESPYRVNAQVAVPSEEAELASALAVKLVRAAEENGAEAEEARDELAMISRVVSELVAQELVRRMDEDPLAVCGVFSNHIVPLWFASSRDILIAGLEAAQEREPLVASFLPLLRTMPIRRESLENASLNQRVVSVLSRPWVIGFVWLPAIAAIVGVFFVDSLLQRLMLVTVVVMLFALALVVDARLRRCPSCRQLLAAMPVGTRHTGTHTRSVLVTTPTGSAHVDQSVPSYATLWRCVYCKHRWG